MRILAIDIGTGTQDILLFDSQQEVENCPKMVMPSPTMLLADAVSAATRRGEDVLLTGVIMGGGPSGRAVGEHLHAGLRVYATAAAARTFNDDLDAVAAMGVTLVSDDEARALGDDVRRLHTGDFNYHALAEAFGRFDIDLDRDLDGIAVGVLDHGHAPPGVSDRVFRFRYLEERLRADHRLSTFAFLAADVPAVMTRMLAVVESSPRQDIPLLLMDTAPAAIVGALEDRAVAGRRPVIVVNVGNSHCLAFRLGETGVEGLFEHHTAKLSGGQLDNLLEQLAEGRLSHARVFEDHGHGVLFLNREAMAPEERRVVVTGPRRGLLRGSRLSPAFAAPFGDMMMTGCFGLIQTYGQVVPGACEAIDRALSGGSSEAPH